VHEKHSVGVVKQKHLKTWSSSIQLQFLKCI